MEARDPLKLKAISLAFIGFFLVVVLLNFINGEIEFIAKKTTSQVRFDVKKTIKKNTQAMRKPKRTKKPRNKVRSLKPKMDLAFASSGLDLGLDLFGISAQGSKLLAQTGDTVMTEDVVDRLPQVQYREMIPYPPSAKEKNINGHVTVNILVNKSGTVDRVSLLDSRPEGVFDQVTLQAVRDWSFTPAEYKGRYVSVWVKQKLKFQGRSL